MKSVRLLIVLATAATVLICADSSFANVGEAYGFGSRTNALGGAGAAWGFEAFSAYENPAGLPVMGNRRLQISYGLMDAEYRFRPINNVVIENQYVSDKTRTGSVDTSYRSTLGNELGFAYQLFPDFHRFSIGLTTWIPINQLAYMDTGETFIPEYFLYRARTLRPQFEFGAGMETAPGLFVGAGLHLAFSLTSNATVFINTQNTSSMRFSSSLKPKLAPYLGFLWVPNYNPQTLTAPDGGPEAPFSLGLVIRGPVTSANTMELNTAGRFLAGLGALDFSLSANSALFYDPWSFELGTSFEYLEKLRAFLQIEAQLWSKFEAPQIVMQDLSVRQNTVPIKPTNNPVFGYRDIFVPRIGNEWKIRETVVLRTGYAFRPSILKGLSDGAGNYVDPPKHMFSAGIGLKYPTFLSFPVPCKIDFNVLYHYLVTQQINKTPGDEAGNPTDRDGNPTHKIGSPGYEAGGTVFGGGASLSLAF